MQRIELKKGDDAWIFQTNHKGKMVQGTVIEVIRLDGYSFDHYIIAIPTGIDDVLEIRSPCEVSDSADKPIGLWRKGGLQKFWSDVKS